MDYMSAPRRHSSCSMNNSVTPPRSPTFLIDRASPVPDESTIFGANLIEGLHGSLNSLTQHPNHNFVNLLAFQDSKQHNFIGFAIFIKDAKHYKLTMF